MCKQRFDETLHANFCVTVFYIQLVVIYLGEKVFYKAIDMNAVSLLNFKKTLRGTDYKD